MAGLEAAISPHTGCVPRWITGSEPGDDAERTVVSPHTGRVPRWITGSEPGDDAERTVVSPRTGRVPRRITGSEPGDDAERTVVARRERRISAAFAQGGPVLAPMGLDPRIGRAMARSRRTMTVDARCHFIRVTIFSRPRMPGSSPGRTADRGIHSTLALPCLDAYGARPGIRAEGPMDSNDRLRLPGLP